jgi:hypothetical protein
LIARLKNIEDSLGDIEVKLPQVGDDELTGYEVKWNANIEYVHVEDDDNGKNIVVIF